ncbi:MAG TPA: efflux RND transporter periplasmic adaptor subunit [Candidatus Macondimonas sp.]|nr:efflux RND transporter periplasmic adaptor subunit [Candidatus Macondimonas sp.]
MKAWTKWLMVLLWCGMGSLGAQEELPLEAARRDAAGIRSGPLVVVDGALPIRLPARVAVPNDRLRVVSARLPGIVEILEVGEGEPVAAGQVLARVHSADLAAMESDHLSAMARFALANAAMTRDRDLHDQGIIARRRFEDTQAQWREAQVALDHSRTSLKLAGLDPTQIQALERIGRTTGTLSITSPIAGVVLTQSVTAGQQVAVADPLYTIGDLRELWLEIHAPPTVAAQVNLKDRVRIAQPPAEGEIIAVGRQIHSADQGVLLRARLTPNAQTLLPGQFVETTLEIQADQGELYEVPGAALAYLDNKPHVFLETPGGYRPVPVTVVSETGDRRIIKGALIPTDKVAVAGVASLKAMASGLGGGK